MEFQLEALLWRPRCLGAIVAQSMSLAYMDTKLYQGGPHALEHGICIIAHDLG